MTVERTLQVNQLIKKELGPIIFKGVDFPEGVLITLTRVETTPNLIQAKIYISVMPEEKTSEAIDVLKKTAYELQQKLNRRLKMRPIPKIMFVEERATKQAGRVEELLEQVKKDVQ